MKLNFSKTFKVASLMLVLCIIGVAVAGCSFSNADQKANEQREDAIQQRADIFARAQAAIPVPQVTHFLARQTLAKYVERQDVPSHLFYIYVLSDFGTCMGYYVAQSAPVNVNAFLSSTESVYDNSNGIAVTTAPSIDGIFYGGSGSSQGGDNWFFFDSESDALVMLYGLKMFVSDQPLNIDAPRLHPGGALVNINTSGQ